jgi:hypothetical protein
MTNPRTSLSEAANQIYEAYAIAAVLQGFRIEVDHYGRVDLVDRDGNREPLFSACLREEK